VGQRCGVGEPGCGGQRVGGRTCRSLQDVQCRVLPTFGSCHSLHSWGGKGAGVVVTGVTGAWECLHTIRHPRPCTMGPVRSMWGGGGALAGTRQPMSWL
jgi:hypothetical protein